MAIIAGRGENTEMGVAVRGAVGSQQPIKLILGVLLLFLRS
jgi:hypothetical protein